MSFWRNVSGNKHSYVSQSFINFYQIVPLELTKRVQKAKHNTAVDNERNRNPEKGWKS